MELKGSINLKKIENKNEVFFKKQIFWIYALSFILPIISMVLIFALKSIFPFGDRSFLRTDMYHQYAPFFSELQYKLKNFDSLFYTWDVGLGTNFLTIISYYLSCPLNLLLIIIPKKYVIDFMAYLIVVKMGLASLCMTYYLVKKFKNANFGATAFGIFYGMSGYFAAYSWNIMWLDCVILLPLIILGLEEIVYHSGIKNKKGKYGLLYTITLSLAILSNYYIAAMICIFAFIYFIVLNILSNDKKPKIYIRRFINFSFYSVIAALIAGILLIPVICAFKTTASQAFHFPTKWQEYFSILDTIQRHLPFVDIENGLDHWANVYSGTLSLFLIIFFFYQKKISIKEKITYILFLIFMYASFSLNFIYFFWHILHFPNSLPSRHSFVYIFVIILMSYKAFLKMPNISTKELGIGFAFFTVLILILHHTNDSNRLHFYAFYFGILFALAYFVLLYLLKTKKLKSEMFFALILILVWVETTLNMGITSITTTSRSGYLKESSDVLVLNDYIKQREEDFYRIEKITRKTKDDGAFMNFPSASIFSSTAYEAGSKFYTKVGCEAAMNAYSITGSTPLANALFGLKYAYYSKKVDNASALNVNYITSSNDVHLYENKNVLPLAFVLDNDEIKGFDFSSANPATIQNNFSKTFGGARSVLEKQDIKPNGASVDFTTIDDGDFYVFVRDLSIEEIYVNLPSGGKTYKNLDRGFFAELGFLKKGTTVTMKNQKKDAKDFKCEVFRFNYDVLSRVCEHIKNDSTFTLNKWGQSSLKYTLNAKKDGTVLMSVPFDKSWTVFVDGKKVEAKALANFFESFDITKGEHVIEMSFVPFGFKWGVVASAVGIVLLLIVQYLSHVSWKRRIEPNKCSTERMQ